EPHVAPGVQVDVEQVHRCEGARRSLCAAELAGNDAHRAAVLRQAHYRDVLRKQRLVARRGHLRFRWQVHPQLQRLEAAAAPRERRAVHLLVQQARAGGHPLHVAGPNAPAVAGGILVVDLALEHDSNRLEAAVRMPAHAARLLARREVGRAGMVEQQEGRELRPLLVMEHRMYREAVADSVAFALAMNAEDVFHAEQYGIEQLDKKAQNIAYSDLITR